MNMKKRMVSLTHAIVVSELTSDKHRIVIKATEYMQIAALFVRDAAKQIVKGTAGEYADYNSMTLTILAGKYKVYYVEKVGDLPVPASEAGKEFTGWLDINNTVPKPNSENYKDWLFAG